MARITTQKAKASTEPSVQRSDNPNERYLLQSVENALGMLDLFIEHEELSATEIGNLLGMNRSKAFRFLVTLEHAGYVTKTENTKYRLSAKVSTLGQVAQNRSELINLVHPFLVDLTEKTGESANLAVMVNHSESSFIDRSLGTMKLRMELTPGYREIAHNSATGKAMLAYQSDQFINNYLRTATFTMKTEKSIRDAKELLNRLAAIREDGYSIDDEESEYGMTCFAVPILVSGLPVAAISISGPTTRMLHNQENVIDLLKKAAAKIEEAMTK